MYDELINKLWAAARVIPGLQFTGYFGAPFNFGPDDLIQAADAIEELKAYADLYEHTSAMGLKLARSVLEAWPKWIPVSDRLPEEYTRVIGLMAWKAMTAVEYQNGKWYSIDHLAPLPDEAVTHWMPLPKPPAEEAEK